MIQILRLRAHGTRLYAVSAIVGNCLVGVPGAAVAADELPSRVPPAESGKGSATAKFRVAITILPAPRASRSGLVPYDLAQLDGTVEDLHGATVTTTVDGRHVILDVE